MTKKVPAKKVPAKKVPAKKVPAKKVLAKKVPAKKVLAKKVLAKKVLAKKVPATDYSATQQLTPGAISSYLFGIDPDRDEQAPQICAETLLTLSANNYSPCPVAEFRSPKRQRFALRSLATGTNFLGGRTKGHAGDDKMTPHELGALLAGGRDIRGSVQMDLAQRMLQGLIDPETQERRQSGVWLLRPFHESLLWYDARKESPNRPDYSVRKVHMRGSGITLARLLVDPVDPHAAELGRAAVGAIKEALLSPSPMAEISNLLESAVLDQPYNKPPPPQDDERESWVRGESPELLELSQQLCRHAEGVMLQGGASPAARLWQLRSILSLDLAMHIVRTAWSATNTPEEERYLLLAFGGAPRALDPVRQRSEESYRRIRIRLGESIVRTLARRMAQLAGETKNWSEQFQKGHKLGNMKDENSAAKQLSLLKNDATADDYLRIARSAVEVADYGRGAGDGFRVLAESAGLLMGTGAYRFFTASTDLLAALVGALSADMPMSSREFFDAIRREWGFVVHQPATAGTLLMTQVDGPLLQRNARSAERTLQAAGLALSLSDRTTVVGERAER